MAKASNNIFLFLFVILTTGFPKVYSQSLYSHNKDIIALFTDTLGNLYFLDNQKNLLTYKNGEVFKLDLQDDIKEIYSSNQFGNLITTGNKKLSNANLTNQIFQPPLANRQLEKDILQRNYGSDDSLLAPPLNVDENCPLPDSIQEIQNIIFFNGERAILNRDRLYVGCNNQIIDLPFDATDMCYSNNQIIISSQSNGLWVYENQLIRQLYIPGLAWPTSISKLIARSDKIWIITQSQELLVFDTRRQTLKPIDSGVSMAAIDDWEYLWYTKDNKLLGDERFLNQKPPQIKLFIDSETDPLEVKKRLKLKQGDDIRFSLSVNYPPVKEKIKRQYKINSDNWQPFEDPLEFTFDHNGINKLYFRALVNENSYSKPIYCEVFVEEDIFKSAWIVILSIALLCLILLVGFLRKAKNEKKNSDARRRELEYKLKMLEAEQRHRQSQMNPHFIFNVLNSINGLIATNESSKARRAINDFASLMRSVLEYSSQQSVDLNSELEFLSSYMELQKLTTANEFDFHIINTSSNVQIPPMMIQPFLENSIVHGIAKTKGKGNISMTVSEINHYLRVEIVDSGKNNDVKSDDANHNSAATQIYYERFQRLDKWGKSKPLSYERLKDETGADLGMKCTFYIPKI